MAGTPEETSHEVNELTKHDESEIENVLSSTVGEFERSSFKLHLKRQAQLCKSALVSKYKYLPESLSEIGAAFEEFIFNPISKADKEQQDARFNLYPPFLIPERTACYSSFFNVVPLPFSCMANRSGTTKIQELKEKKSYDYLPKFDDDTFVIADGLGSEVTATEALPRNSRLVHLQQDYDRISIMKDKLRYVNHFAYPALNLPPKINKQLITSLFKPFQVGAEGENADYVFTEVDFAELLKDYPCDSTPEQLAGIFRKNLLKTIQYVLPVKLMEAMFRHAGYIKKVQEILHYTFHHGFIRYLGDITQRNLSNFVTFHGMTFENRNNNSTVHTTLDLIDGEDYMVDTIYLFLVMTWQTVMGIWQQNLNSTNMELLKSLLKKKGKTLLMIRDCDFMAEQILDWITDSGELIKIFQECSPDFASQMQLAVFRTFILARSNIVAGLVPALVKDFVPTCYQESPPSLWTHVYLLNLSYYLFNHGDYCQTFFFTDAEIKTPENSIYCNCNLCAPHRVPAYNVALHNEIQAIGTFDFLVPKSDGEDQRLSLSPGLWGNSYLEHFFGSDFFPFEVKKYLDFPNEFRAEMRACVITKPRVLSAINHIRKQKEKFLLEKGSGIYLDPETGETLNPKLLSQSSEHSAKHTTTSTGVTKPEEDKKEEKSSRYLL